MNESIQTFEALKVFLIQNCGAKLASGGKEITKKCHICGDSRDPSSRHMYIGMRDGVIVYNCFKCNSSGIVDRTFLRDIGCEDIDLMRLCVQNNQSNYRTSENTDKRRIRKFSNPIITYHDTPGNAKKLESLKNRMGFDFFNKLNEFKIILNLSEFLNDNGINHYTRDPNIMKELSEFYIGFLSSSNQYINLRRLVPEEKVHPFIRSRYVKYNIFGSEIPDYYMIPSIINLNDIITICIAEGPFDIIGAYLNFYIRNSIYAAIGGKSYLKLIQYLIAKYGLMRFELHIFADNDIKQYELQNVYNFLKPYGNFIYVHRNGYPNQKDFGVKKELIQDNIIKLN